MPDPIPLLCSLAELRCLVTTDMALRWNLPCASPRARAFGGARKAEAKSLDFRLGRDVLKSRGVFEFLEPARPRRDAVLAGQLAHPIKITVTLLDGQVKVHPRQFLAGGANVEVALDPAQAGEFFLRPGGRAVSRGCAFHCFSKPKSQSLGVPAIPKCPRAKPMVIAQTTPRSRSFRT